VRIVRIANFVSPTSGGLRTALRCLGVGYLAAGHEPVLIAPGPTDSDELTGQGRVITVRGPLLPASGGYRVLLARARVRGLLDELRPDRIEVSDRTSLRWTGAWARERGVPSVMVSHESVAGLLGLAGRLFAGPTGALADVLNRRTAQHYTRVVCTTQWAAAEFERLGVANLARVPLGVDLDLFSPERHSAALRARYAKPGEALLVHCGRLSPEKKPQRSIRALARLREQGVPARLLVVGAGPLGKRLRRLAGDLPVRFLGFVRERAALASLLASADVVLAPGPVETFGLAALEALACGTPVVVDAASALPEVVGEAGIAVADEDFAAGVAALLAQPAPARRAAARRRAEEFGWPAAVAGFLAAHGLSSSADVAGGAICRPSWDGTNLDSAGLASAALALAGSGSVEVPGVR
jgi:alpha-1,6-mannosyltransferase